MDIKDLSTELSGLHQFKTLKPEQLEELVKQANVRSVEASETFITEGDEATSLFLLTSGAAQVFKADAMGQPTVLTRIDAVSLIGDQAFLSRNLGKRTASVRAIEACVLVEIDGNQFRQFLNKHLEVIRSTSAIGKLQSEFNNFHLSPLVRAMSNRRLLDYCERRHFVAGDKVFEEGDTGTDVYLVTDGSVTIYRQVRQTQHKVATIRPGQSLGELAATDGTARAGTAVCEEPTQLLVIPADLFSDLLTQDDLLSSQMGILKKVYALSEGLMSTQHVGTFDGHTAITTAFHLPAGGVALGTHVPDLESCLLYTSPSPRDLSTSRMPSSA